MKILVTGGAGFIGSHVADALIKAGHQIAIVDDLSTGQKENINKKAKFYKVDISKYKDLKKVFAAEKPEVIFHLAAQANVRKSVEDPLRDTEVNLIGTLNLLELGRKYGLKKFIFSSTGGAIYGDRVPRPTPEEAEAAPASPYGLNKLASEKFIEYFAKNYGIKAVRLRYANVFGPRQNPKGAAGVIAIFGSKMLKGEPIKVYVDGSQTRDYIYVSDVVAANLAALRSDVSDVYNIGNAKEIPLKQIIDELKKLTKTKSKIIFGKSQPGEQQRSALANGKARQGLDWEPKVSFREGIWMTIEYLKRKS